MAQMNRSMKQKQTFRHRDQTCGCHRVGEEGEGWKVWGWWLPTITYKMDKKQGPTVWFRELYPLSWDKP